MTRKLVTVLLSSVILLLVAAAPVFAGGLSSATTKVVDDDGLAGVTEDGYADCTDGFKPATAVPPLSGEDARVFATIQAAVNAASAGDDIFVCPGTYNEAVTVGTQLKLWGPYAGVSAEGCPSRSGQAVIVGSGGSPAL